MARSLLEIDDLSPSELAHLLDSAARWKKEPDTAPRALEGAGVALVFEKPSARTRTSAELAVYSLGGHPVALRAEEIGIDQRESAEDVARILASYCVIIAARVFDHGVLMRMAGAVNTPVVNLLSDIAHPCQALADLLTISERFGGLEGRRVAFVGDGNNVVASLAYGAALTGLELIVSSPPGYELNENLVDRVRNLGGSIELVTDPHEAVRGVDVVYTDAWTSMGQEAESEARTKAFATWRVDSVLMAEAGADAVFMHCLPAHRGDEVTAEVIDGPVSVVWQQAENRMHTKRALFAWLVQTKESE
ncbi:MAG: ornithine carbamoyltransferase [Acidimicrobiia bacterium]|nr:ornithine carbamoyltransferase [Acidimicrobiia bacterium]